MTSAPDVVICLANRRWSGLYDRSQHLMSQCAQERTAVFVEEPEYDSTGPDVELSETRTGVITLIPHVPATSTVEVTRRAQRCAIDFVLAHVGCTRPVLWYYAPQAIAYTDHVDPAAMVYDWLERTPETAGLPADVGSVHDAGVPCLWLGRSHQQVLDRADVVFTDGEPDHRRLVHHNVHPFGGTDGTWADVWRAMWSHVEHAIVDRGQLGTQIVSASR